MWDMYGLEYLVDWTAGQQQKLLETLKGKDRSFVLPNLMHLRLRAHFNSQRHYEIYVFEAEEGITADDITEMFKADPQYAADLIRQRGQCYYSNRVQDEERIVIR